MLPEPLAPLATLRQFVAWRLEWNAERQKWDKIPYSPAHGRRASSTNPADWGSFEQADELARAQQMHGVGFVFSASDPYFFLDIDGALQDGQWSPVAQELCAALPGCAVEISQSGTGLHVIGRGALPPDHAKRNIPLRLELYTQERFVALTGTGAVGNVDTPVDPAVLTSIADRYFTRVQAGPSEGWTTEPCADWSGPGDDGALLEIALRSQGGGAAGAFGDDAGRITFADLFNADVDKLAARWPSNVPGGDFDHSSADQSLANAMAFWTGRDCGRMDRLMRLSALARAKWDDRPDYLETTILKAAALVQTVYKGATPKPAPEPLPEDYRAPAGSGIEVRGDSAYMAFDQQVQHFAGCIYVSGPHRILTPSGDLMDRGRFDAVYGGYEFVVSPDGKKSTTSAWEAYTQAQAYRPARADRLCFRPEHGAGGVVLDSGKRLANTYFPAAPDVVEGDPGKFLDHMRRMLPRGDDLEILLSYMAAVVQTPGMKAQWWPVVQGAQGNFKSFLLVIMSNAVGNHYAHMPNMDKMVRGNSNFNGWIDRKLFLGLDEVYAADRRGFFEGFKTTVTNRSLPIEAKGIEETTGDNRANGMIVTNHKSGVPIIGSNRRYAPFFCAQQTPEDMIRDGMDAAYVSDLKDWLLGEGAYRTRGPMYGVRVMGHYLHTRAVADQHHPARLAIRCPETSATAEAIEAGRGQIEQEILEAVEQGEPGFAGDWISSIWVDRLIDRHRFNLPRNKRRELLNSLGYDWHPALGANGRSNTVIQPDNGKPRLFCKVNSISWNNLPDAASVARAYSSAQSAGVSAAFGT